MRRYLIPFVSLFLLSYNVYCQELKFTQDEKYLIEANERVRVWEYASGRLVSEIDYKKKANYGNYSIQYLSAISPDNKILALSQSVNAIELWDLENGFFIDTIAIPQRGFAFGKDPNTLLVHNTQENNISKVLIKTKEIIPTSIKLSKIFYNKATFLGDYVFIDEAGMFRLFHMYSGNEIKLSNLNKVEDENEVIRKKDKNSSNSSKQWRLHDVTMTNAGLLCGIMTFDYYDKKRYFLNFSLDINNPDKVNFKIYDYKSENSYSSSISSALSKQAKYFVFYESAIDDKNNLVKDFNTFKTITQFNKNDNLYTFKRDSTLISHNYYTKGITEIVVKSGKPTGKVFETEIKYTEAQKQKLDSVNNAQKQAIALRLKKEEEIKSQKLEEERAKSRIESIKKQSFDIVVSKCRGRGSDTVVLPKKVYTGNAYNVLLVKVIKSYDALFLYNEQGFTLGDVSLPSKIGVNIANLSADINTQNIDYALDIYRTLICVNQYEEVSKFLFSKIDDFTLQGNKLTKEQLNILARAADIKKENEEYVTFEKKESYWAAELKRLKKHPLLFDYYGRIICENKISIITYPLVKRNLEESIGKYFKDKSIFELKYTTNTKSVSKPTTAKGDIGSFQSDDTSFYFVNAKMSFQKENYFSAESNITKYLALEKKPAAIAYWILGASQYNLKKYKEAQTAFTKLKKSFDPYFVNLYHPNLDKLIAFSAKPIGAAPVPVDKFLVFEDIEDLYAAKIQKFNSTNDKKYIAGVDSVALLYKNNGDTKSYEKAQLTIARCYNEAKEYKKAEQIARNCVTSKDIKFDAIHVIAQSLIYRKEHSQCKKLLDSISLAQKDSMVVAKSYGIYYSDLGFDNLDRKRFGYAVDNFMKSLLFDHNNAMIHMTIGSLMYDPKIMAPGYDNTDFGRNESFGYFHLRKSLDINPDLKYQFPIIYKNL